MVHALAETYFSGCKFSDCSARERASSFAKGLDHPDVRTTFCEFAVMAAQLAAGDDEAEDIVVKPAV